MHLVGYLYYWQMRFNSVFKGLNPICHLLALLGAHHIFHISGLRVNSCYSRSCVCWAVCKLLFLIDCIGTYCTTGSHHSSLCLCSKYCAISVCVCVCVCVCIYIYIYIHTHNVTSCSCITRDQLYIYIMRLAVAVYHVTSCKSVSRDRL